MDFKSKGISWVGNIYQKFETMCHEVDNIVSQDTVKYVEDQVNSMGENVKKFYADVVQDLMPPLGDPENCETQAAALKTNTTIGTYVKSMIGIEEDHRDIAILNKSPIEPGDCDVAKNDQGVSFGGNHPVNQLITLTSGDPIERTESHSDPGKFDSSKNEISYVNTGEKAIKDESAAPDVLELTTDAGKKYFEVLFSNEFIDCNRENACGFLAEDLPASSLHGEEFLTCPNVGTVCDNSADDSYFVSDTSNSQKTGTVCDKSSDDSHCVSNALSNLDNGNFYDKPSDDSGCLSDMSSILNPGTVCDDTADDSACAFDASSDLSVSEIALCSASSDKKLVGLEVASSSSSIFAEPLTLSDISINTIRAKLTSSSNPVNASGNDSNSANALLSSASAPAMFCKNSVLETRLATSNTVLPLELAGSSDDLSNIDDDLSESEMETIDLSDKAKLEESCIIIDDSMLHEIFFRARKLRTYKKKIQDVFNSKRRLTKEYELLAILHGDLDTVSGQDTVQNQLSSSNTKIMDSGLQHESGWELL